MEYQVVEKPNASATPQVVAVFESAYDAVAFVESSWYRREVRATNLYVMDSEGSVLLQPWELAGIAGSAN